VYVRYPTSKTGINTMKFLPYFAQIFVALTVISVWTIRFNRATPWRGGNAKNMCEEFSVYGLSAGLRKTVCCLKLSGSLLLLVGLWCAQCTFWGAALLSILMVSAVAMHVKVRDPMRKSLPALVIFVLCLYLMWVYR
jgi:hypothetical protein